MNYVPGPNPTNTTTPNIPPDHPVAHLNDLAQTGVDMTSLVLMALIALVAIAVAVSFLIARRRGDLHIPSKKNLPVDPIKYNEDR